MNGVRVLFNLCTHVQQGVSERVIPNCEQDCWEPEGGEGEGEGIRAVSWLNGLLHNGMYYLVLTCKYLRATARSWQDSHSPVVSESTGNQRGLRGRGKVAAASWLNGCVHVRD